MPSLSVYMTTILIFKAVRTSNLTKIIFYLLTPRSRVLLEKLVGSQLVSSPDFMEPEVSLLRLQQLATCSYPEPDQSSPCAPSHFLKIHLNIIIPSTPESSKFSLSSGFQTNTLYTLLHSPYLLHVQPISFFWI